MPWIRTKDCIPPKDTELYLFKDGKRWKGKLELFDIFDGKGGTNKEKIPDFWANICDGCESWPDPKYEIKGILNESLQVQDDIVDPKLDPNGIEVKNPFRTIGNDGFVSE